MSKKALIKFLTFDITNTLIKVSGSVGSIYSNIAKKYDCFLDEQLATDNFKKLFKLQNQLHPGYGFSKGMKSREWWHYVVRNVIEMDYAHKKLPPLPETTVNRISNEMFDQFSNACYWKKTEHCDLVLEKLKEKGVKLGVISNFDERLFDIIENLNIAKHFEFVCIPANSKGHFKPQPEIFHEAFKKTQLNDKSQMLHVGDDLKLDYQAAHAFGCKSLLILNKSVLSKNIEECMEIMEKQEFIIELKDILEKV